MKLLIAALALALVVPGAAIADIPDQSRPDVGVELDTRALGTDVAASDQQSPVRQPAGVVTPSPRAASSGFEWDDAAVGAAAAIALAAMAGVTATALRRRRRASAVAG